MKPINKKFDFWPDWIIEDKIGEGAFGSVYRAVRKESGAVFYSAIKVITIPPNDYELISLRQQGADDSAITGYYEQIVEDSIREISILEALKGTSHIVSIEDFKVVRDPRETRWFIIIRMELLTPLGQYIAGKGSLSRGDVIRLGLDICDALEYCESEKIIHRDIKLENIFVTKHGAFKLGDFGVARTMEQTASIVSQKGTYSYMAPEVYLGQKYGSTVDIYSLGIVLYKLLNKNKLPFLDTEKQINSADERMEAFAKRIQGTPLPLPCEADPKLGEVILKACSYDPEDRYQSAGELCEALRNASENSRPLSSGKKQIRRDKAGSRSLLTVLSCLLIPVLAVLCVIFAKELKQGRASDPGEPAALSSSAPAEIEPAQAADASAGEETAEAESAVKEKISTAESTVRVKTSSAESTVREKTSSAETSAPQQTGRIIWDDRNLETAVREETGITAPEITRGDLETVQTLDLSGRGIKSIGALAEMKNLTELSLAGNEIRDISPLSALTKLTYLDLGGNQIEDISALSALTDLETLGLEHNAVEDISPLSGAGHLKSLHLTFNSISDISALKNLRSLTLLNLDQNEIQNLDALSGLVNLRKLYLGNNQIEDIGALSGLINLTELNLAVNRIHDIGCLSVMTQLKYLTLNNNLIEDISALSTLRELECLIVRSNPITDFTPIEGGFIEILYK